MMRASEEQFEALVVRPIQGLKTESTDSPSVFYSKAQIESMHRAYLLKANTMLKDNEKLKKYMWDPQAYH